MPPPVDSPVESMMQILCALLEIVSSLLAQLRNLHQDVEQLLLAHDVEEPTMPVPDPDQSDSRQTSEGPPRRRSRSPRR